ncbi:leucyl aminopeptidase, partial [Klebsiella oxytoca]|nr:leucyl aminopeptidase [Klebsiella oxytoca]
MIDLATLTGACLVARGERTAGAMTNDPDLFQAVDQAADSVGEPIWQLPAPEELREAVKGTNADLRNSTGRNGGTITAGVFLEHFVEGKP